MASNRSVEVDQEAIAKLVKELREFPERLDKAMRREFRALAAEIVPRARAAASAAHPIANPDSKGSPTGVNRPGAYKWATLVGTIRAGADKDTPYVVYGSDRTPGWAGWEFGSSRYPQFPPRSPRKGRGNTGYFFTPAVDEEAKDIEKRAHAIYEKYAAMVA